jgi:hypothetical protein
MSEIFDEKIPAPLQSLTRTSDLSDMRSGNAEEMFSILTEKRAMIQRRLPEADFDSVGIGALRHYPDNWRPLVQKSGMRE